MDLLRTKDRQCFRINAAAFMRRSVYGGAIGDVSVMYSINVMPLLVKILFLS